MSTGGKGEEAEQQYDKLAKNSLKMAVDEARNTEGSTGEEDRKHTSGGVCGLLPAESAPQEQELLCRAIELGLTVDQLQGAEPSCYELLVRRLQMSI